MNSGFKSSVYAISIIVNAMIEVDRISIGISFS